MFNLDKDVDSALKHYPHLQKRKEGNVIWIIGTIVINRPNGTILEYFDVRINFQTKFPFGFPKVYETSNKIPANRTRHVNVDDKNSLCLAVKPEEEIICQRGISTKFFLDKVLTQHLAREALVNRGQPYPDGEYEHFDGGIWQFYEKHFDTKEKGIILKWIRIIVENKLPNRNDTCVCGNFLKYKNCHLAALEYVSRLGVKYLTEELDLLTKTNKNEKGN